MVLASELALQGNGWQIMLCPPTQECGLKTLQSRSFCSASAMASCQMIGGRR